MPAIPGAGGIGLAARNPEFDPPDDLDSPQSRHSSRSFTSTSDGSHHEINTAARCVSEKEKPLKRWQVVGRRRLWNIVPYWAICLLITGLLLMGIVMGAVIGTFLHGHKKAPPGPEGDEYPGQEGSPSVTITVDASPIPTPSDLPPIPTGTFALPLIPNKSPSSCFNDTTQATAWTCSIFFGSGMNVVIETVKPFKGGGPLYTIQIGCNQSNIMSNNVWMYGQQPPIIPKPEPLELVNDTFDPSRGPAWFRMKPYNKTVIVPASLLALPSTTAAASPSLEPEREDRKVRRVAAFGGPGDFHRKGTAQVGDKPWICTWPDTLLEVFIYPNQNTSWAKVGPSSSAATPTPMPSQAVNGAQAVAPGQGGRGPYTGSYPMNDESPTPTAAESSVTPTSSIYNFANMPPPYPRVMKIEERRMARSRIATCQQWEIRSENGGPPFARPIFDQNGNHIEIEISESESGPPMAYPFQSKRDLYESQLFPRDNTDLSNCGCLWMVT